MKIAKLVHGQEIKEDEKDFCTQKRVLTNFKEIITDAVPWGVVVRRPEGKALWGEIKAYFDKDDVMPKNYFGEWKGTM